VIQFFFKKLQLQPRETARIGEGSAETEQIEQYSELNRAQGYIEPTTEQSELHTKLLEERESAEQH
jgi:hypothetical protein